MIILSCMAVTEEERAGSATCISCDVRYNHYNEMRCHQPYPIIIPLYLALLPTHIPLLLLRKRALVQLLISISCDLSYKHYNKTRCHQPYPTTIPLYLALLPTPIPQSLMRKRELVQLLSCISCELRYNHYNKMCHPLYPYPTDIPLYLALLPTHIPLLLLRKRELVQLLVFHVTCNTITTMR